VPSPSVSVPSLVWFVLLKREKGREKEKGKGDREKEKKGKGIK
jgi:hypothetical protein